MLLFRLAPYELSLLLSLVCLLLAWPKRNLTGARLLVAALGCELLYTIGYIAEILATTLESKIVWDNAQWPPCLCAALCLALFAREYAQKKSFPTWLVWQLGVVPVAVGILAFTNHWHHYIGTGHRIIPGWPAPALHYEFGKITWLALAYLLGLQVQAVITVGVYLINQHGVFRRQAFGILVGLLFPTLAVVAALFDWQIVGYRDLGPFATAVGNAFVLWSLLRYRALRLLPMARAQVFEQLQTGVLLFDESLRVIDINAAFCKPLQLSSTQALGQTADRVLSDWPSVLEALRRGQATKLELQLKNEPANPGECWSQIDLQPVHEGGQTGWLLLFRDITEQKLAALQAIRSREQAVEASAAKSRFFATLSHEIRTPLAAMMGLNRLLGQTQLDAEQGDLLQKLDAATRHLLELLNHTLDYSKFEAGRLSLAPVEFDLNALLLSISGIFWPIATDKGLQFSLHLEKDVPTTLFGDGLRLKQILANLIGNAIKFTHQGAVSVQVSVAKQEPGFADLCFVVKDTGIGLDAMQAAGLFQPFSQADSSISHRFGGTGLGLSISRQLAQMLGGDLTCESEKSVGSTFFLTARLQLRTKTEPRRQPIVAALPDQAKPTDLLGLPIAAPDVVGDLPSVFSPPRSQNSEPTLEEDHPGPHEASRVLLAEDNHINQQVTQKLLRKIGFECELACDGREVLSLLYRHPPGYFSAVLMDLHMPELDGKTAVVKLRSDPRFDSLPVIALTGESVPEIILDALSCGMDDVLRKPVDLQSLQKTLRRQIGIKRRAGREQPNREPAPLQHDKPV